MGRTHNATVLSFHPQSRRTRFCFVLLMLFLACVVILLTPYRLRADVPTPSSSVTATHTAVGSPSAETPKPLWSSLADSPDTSSPAPSTSSRALKGFFYLLGAILLGITLHKKYSSKRKTLTEVEINVIARKAVSPKHALLVITVEGERLLLAQSSENLSFVTKLSSSHFSSELAQLMDNDQGEEDDAMPNLGNHIKSSPLQKVGNS